MLNKLVFYILFTLVCCVACVKAEHFQVNTIVPSDAIDVKEEELQINEGYRFPPLRTKYKLKRVYPNTDIVDFYTNNLSSRGWVLCGRAGGDIEETWESYFQMLPNKKKQYVRQIFKYIVNRAESEIISLRLYYVGSVNDTSASEAKWDITNQFVDVTHYKLYPDKYGDIMRFYSTIGLDCTGA
jgi:hypothetical protein